MVRSANNARRCFIQPMSPQLFSVQGLRRSAYPRRPRQAKSIGRCAIIPPFRRSGSMKLIDVSVPLDATLPTYPSNTPFTLEPIKRIARGDSSNVSTIHMSAHAGTHVDAPRHFFDAGTGTESLPLEMLCGRARVVEITSRTISADDLAAIDLSEDVRVLFKTHNSRLWSDPIFHAEYVGVTESGAKHLVDHGVKV